LVTAGQKRKIHKKKAGFLKVHTLKKKIIIIIIFQQGNQATCGPHQKKIIKTKPKITMILQQVTKPHQKKKKKKKEKKKKKRIKKDVKQWKKEIKEE